MENLEKLKNDEVPLLVFSDVAARELDGFGQVEPARKDRAKPDRTRRRPEKGRWKVAKDGKPAA